MFIRTDKYNESLDVLSIHENYEFLEDRIVLIAGACGMIGTYIVDILMHLNIKYRKNISVIAMDKNESLGKERFATYSDNPHFIFEFHDVRNPIPKRIGRVNYVINAASITSPNEYKNDPITTINTNFEGTKNLLEYSANNNVRRFVFCSSVEVYGTNRGDVDEFDEKYFGYIDCNTLRAGYPESKRVAEALCCAYLATLEVEYVIARIARVYGPTMILSDSKAVSQFLLNGSMGREVTLKSHGKQHYSYIYAGDTASAIIMLLDRGKCGEAYNVADKKSKIQLSKIAKMIAQVSSSTLKYEINENIESEGYSTVEKALMSTKKIEHLGWTPKFSLKAGIDITYDMLHKMIEKGK